MPRFFFDTDDGERQFCDEIGIDLADPHDVPKEAIGLLRDLAHVHLPIGRRDMAVEVRGAAGTPVYRAVMTIVGEAIE
jgi:hypothetical protein